MKTGVTENNQIKNEVEETEIKEITNKQVEEKTEVKVPTNEDDAK